MVFSPSATGDLLNLKTNEVFNSMKNSITFFLIIFSATRLVAQKPGTASLTDSSSYYLPPLRIGADLNAIHQTSNKVMSLTFPAMFITYGFVALGNDGLQNLNKSTRTEIEEHHPAFVTKVDNYLQFSPAIAVYGLNALGIKGKNNFRDRTIIYALSNVIAASIVLPLKKITKVQRPDGSAFNSFPSGHTATAFAAAEFMREEYSDVSPWYGIAGYGAAVATATLRLYNNKHWVSDVVEGAGVGILSTKLAYWLYPYIKKKLLGKRPVSSVLMPYYQNKMYGLSLVHSFHS